MAAPNLTGDGQLKALGDFTCSPDLTTGMEIRKYLCDKFYRFVKRKKFRTFLLTRLIFLGTYVYLMWDVIS